MINGKAELETVEAPPPNLEPLSTEEWGATVVQFSAGERIEVREDGLFLVRADAEAEIEGEIPTAAVPITYSPISIYAATDPVDPEGEAGLILQWRTARGDIQRQTVSASQLFKPGNPIVAQIAGRGIRLDARQQKNLVRYLGAASPPRRALAYRRSGWQKDPDGRTVFVLGEQVHGAATESVFQPDGLGTEIRAGVRGTHEDWLAQVARPACVLPWWRLAIMASLSAPLLAPLDEPGTGLHVVGGTSMGKTIGLQVAASVFGSGAKNATASFVQTWNATAAGVEGEAEAHNDLAMILDELAEADPRSVGRIIYQLTDGTGKSRMRSDVTLRSRKKWRIAILSSGEQTIESKIAEGGGRMAGGQAVRLIELAVDNSGLLSRIDQAEANRLGRATGSVYGTAGSAFVQRLVELRYGDPAGEAVIALRTRVEEIRAELVGEDLDPRRGRAARSLAVIQAAGELAIEFCVLPPEIEPATTVRHAYRVWRESVGTTQVDDTRATAGRLVSYVDGHRDATILKIEPTNLVSEGELREAEQSSRERDGWYDDRQPHRVYLTRRALERILNGYSLTSFLNGIRSPQVRALRPGDGRNLQVKVPGLRTRPRAYEIDIEELRAWCDEDSEGAAS